MTFWNNVAFSASFGLEKYISEQILEHANKGLNACVIDKPIPLAIIERMAAAGFLVSKQDVSSRHLVVWNWSGDSKKSENN